MILCVVSAVCLLLSMCGRALAAESTASPGCSGAAQGEPCLESAVQEAFPAVGDARPTAAASQVKVRLHEMDCRIREASVEQAKKGADTSANARSRAIWGEEYRARKRDFEDRCPG